MASKLASQTESSKHTLCATATATRAGLRNKVIRTVASAAPPPAAPAPEAAPAAAPVAALVTAVLAAPPAPAAGPRGALALILPVAHALPGAYLIGANAVLVIDAEYAELEGLAPGFAQLAVEEDGLLSLLYCLCEAELRFHQGTSSLCVDLGAEMCMAYVGKYHQGWQRNDDGSLLLVLGSRNFKMTLAQCLVRLVQGHGYQKGLM